MHPFQKEHAVQFYQPMMRIALVLMSESDHDGFSGDCRLADVRFVSVQLRTTSVRLWLAARHEPML
ncbi:hypothetical protein CO675_36800 [Bradyrhizobium sp. C9]|nr:hypothetical protein CO675_36800 [Bradyrhizobium sp. C9]